MSAYPAFPNRISHCLDGIWDFAYLGDSIDLGALQPDRISYNDRLPVPGCFDASPAYAGKRGTAVYRTCVKTTPNTPGIIEFAGLGMWSRICVDGVPLEDAAMPYSQIQVRIPPSPRAERELVVISDNRFDRVRTPLFEQFFDFYAYGGIFRSLVWHELPPRHLDRVRITTADVAAGVINASIRFADQFTEAVRMAVQIDDGEPVSFADVPVQDGVAELTLTVPDPTAWSPAHPALHTLRLTAGDDCIVERFGLRTVETRGSEILLNGSPLKLLGYCRHEAHPQFGPALPLAQLVQDAQLLRSMGCNFVRGSHYPQDPRFLDLCDELGLLVWEESLGWGQTPEHFTNPAFQDAQVKQTEAMVRKSFNHPCVIMWAFLNEGHSHRPESREMYERLVAAIRSMDGSRPVTYASNHPLDDLNFDLVDIVSINMYPGWYAHDREKLSPSDEIVPQIQRVMASLSERGHGDKPFMLTEIGAGAIYGWRDDLQAHWSEEYQADYLKQVCDEVCANTAISGLALWQFCDCRTYSSARALTRPRAFNNKGSYDEYRRPKLAAAVVRQAFTAYER